MAKPRQDDLQSKQHPIFFFLWDWGELFQALRVRELKGAACVREMDRGRLRQNPTVSWKKASTSRSSQGGGQSPQQEFLVKTCVHVSQFVWSNYIWSERYWYWGKTGLVTLINYPNNVKFGHTGGLDLSFNLSLLNIVLSLQVTWLWLKNISFFSSQHIYLLDSYNQ